MPVSGETFPGENNLLARTTKRFDTRRLILMGIYGSHIENKTGSYTEFIGKKLTVGIKESFMNAVRNNEYLAFIDCKSFADGPSLYLSQCDNSVGQSQRCFHLVVTCLDLPPRGRSHYALEE